MADWTISYEFDAYSEAGHQKSLQRLFGECVEFHYTKTDDGWSASGVFKDNANRAVLNEIMGV